MTSTPLKGINNPSKRQKVTSGRSLLQFGFTETAKETASQPSPAGIEFVQCPQCNGLFTTDKIITHTEICNNLNSFSAECLNKDKLPNAFDIMKSSSKIKPAEIQQHHAYFSLILRHGKLLPVFYYNEARTKELFKNGSSIYNIWQCESKVRKFRYRYRAPVGVGSTEDMVVHLYTNISSASSDSVDQFVLPNAAQRGSSSSSRHVGSGPGQAPGSPAVSVPLLKSMLQKAVRRRQTLKAVRLAGMLCDAHSPPSQSTGSSTGSSSSSSSTKPSSSSLSSPLNELLRRLPIICLEDTALHPGFPVLVWLMVAVSKGYHPPAALVHTVLLIVADMANSTHKDCLPPEHALPPVQSLTSDRSTTLDTNSNGLELRDLGNDAARTVLASISLRASFGGMTGDMAMLDQYAQLWCERLVSGSTMRDTAEIGAAAVEVCTEATSEAETALSVAPIAASQTTGDAALGQVWTVPYLHQDFCSALQTAGDSTVCGGHSWGQQLFQPFSSSETTAADIHCTHSECDNAHWESVTQQQLLAVMQGLQPSDSTSSTLTTGKSEIASPNTVRRNTTAELHRLLKVSAQDLVPEGLDQHVDYSLVPHIVHTCREKLLLYYNTTPSSTATTTTSVFSHDTSSHLIGNSLPERVEDDIKSAIWLFRSSNNSRKLYPLLERASESCCLCKDISSYHRQWVSRELAQKQQLARLWGVICPVLVAYCERKLAIMARRL